MDREYVFRLLSYYYVETKGTGWVTKEAKKEDPEGQETTEYGKSVGEEKSTAESRPTTMERQVV